VADPLKKFSLSNSTEKKLLLHGEARWFVINVSVDSIEFTQRGRLSSEWMTGG